MECPLEMIQCEFYDIGCEAKLYRKDEESHAKDCVTTHLQLAQRRLTILNRMLEDSNTRQLESSENFTVLLSQLQERIRTFEGIHTDQSSQSTKEQSVDVEVQTDVNSIDILVATSTFSKLIRYFIIPRNPNVVALMILMSSIAISMATLYINYNRNISTTTTDYSPPTVQEFHEKVSVALYELIDQSALPWCSKLYYWSNTATIVTPVVVKFSEFSKQKYSILYSNTFFGFTNGYLMRLRIYPSGSPGITIKHFYMSVYLDFMVGPHDNTLDKLGYFPINKSFTIELLNPNDDNSHLQKEISCNITWVIGDDGSTKHGGCGFSTFISLEGYDFKQKCRCDKTNVSICCYLTDDDTIYFRVQEKSKKPQYQIAPVSFKLTKCSRWVKSNKEWYSGPFFAFNGGYQMCLKVVVAGYGEGEGTHVSVDLYLMKGPHDDELEQSGHWPLRGTFTIELLNQLNDSDHHRHMVQFHHYLCSESANRVLEGVTANSGCGQQQFISHDNLLIHYSNIAYYEDDSLIFRISYEGTEPLYQVIPATFKLTHFSKWLESKEAWYSIPFFAFNEGYQMQLYVSTAGYGDGEGTHVSVYLYLMKGPHDDELEQSGHWPLRGTFTIEVLNQLNDSDHHTHMVQFQHHLSEECTNRVLDEVIAQSGLGRQQFISHHTLYNNGYMESDSLIFRVSYNSIEPPHQIAPVIFKLIKFSLWFTNKKEWYSSPFFAFNGGYQMCLKVYAAGNGGGEGTHVSVFLYLMKGSHDDELEQSGHWPLRGTFTIELLNQVNGSNHHSVIVQFHHHLCEERTNRVIDSVMAYSGLGHQQFISYANLFNNGCIQSDSLIFKITYESIEAPYQIAPVTFKLTKFSKCVKTKEQWGSSPFFTFSGGYRMCLKIDVVGYGEGEGTHVSVDLYLMKGPHDDELEQSGHWPLRGTFTIELLNQLNDSEHHRHMVQFHHYLCSESANRVLEGVTANSGCGQQQFISHDNLLIHYSNIAYYEDDSLIFRISYEGTEPPYQVIPATFKLTHFSKWLESKEAWYSIPFFAFNRGYQMQLYVSTAGYGDSKGTHVSVYLYLMKGPHDDELEQSGHWPLRGTFTIELLNQLNNSDHCSHMVQFHHHLCEECTNRVLDEVIAQSGLGRQQFISHHTLYNNGYMESDSLIFRVSYESNEPPHQTAPVISKLTKFSQWVKSRKEWYSSPFFAFNGGYQMCLKVVAAGSGKGEGTHVSVFLYLMKGPHDDELEQSGHWPLRGTFTIELLNQLNDSNHHSVIAQLYHHRCSRCINRVLDLEDVMVNTIHARPQFISHDSLFDHTNSGYYHDDSLIFRISYEDAEPPDQVAPVTFKLRKFSEWVNSKQVWLSNTFFAFKGGYQMFLNIKAADYIENETTYISVFLYLMKGPHDDELEQSGHWPLKGIFTIELLNQLNDDSDHYSPILYFIPSRGVNRVTGDEVHTVEGVVQYISHDTLFQHNGYLINDTLYFRISYFANNDGTKGVFFTY